MAYLQFLGYRVPPEQIIGLGPLTSAKGHGESGVLQVEFFFDVLLVNYALRLTTGKISALNTPEEAQSLKILSDFNAAYISLTDYLDLREGEPAGVKYVAPVSPETPAP